MTHSDDSIPISSRGKSRYGIRGTLHYGGSDVSSLTQQRLLRSFLCDGENSLCVLTHTCECLKASQYGQRYLQTLEEEQRNPPRGRSSKTK